jgi:signal transduction histidine kinase
VVPRFLHQKSAPARLLALLLFGALLPSIVLAAYGIKGLLEADQVYDAGLRNQREGKAAALHQTVVEQTHSFVKSLHQAAEAICNDGQWRISAAACARAWKAQGSHAREALLVGSSGEVLFPSQSETVSIETSALMLLARDRNPQPLSGASFALRHLESTSLKMVAGEGQLGGNRIFLSIDQTMLRDDLAPLLNSFNRSNPSFSASIIATNTPQDDLNTPAQGASSSRIAIGPSLPGYSLQLRTLSAARNPASGSPLWLQVGLLVLLVGIVALAIRISTRTLRHEVQVAHMKSDFVANVSHELRTPLTTIRIMAEMLTLGAVPDGDKQAEYHRNIVSEAERLTRLINNVLDFARIEEGRKKFTFGMGDLGDVVFEVVRIIGDYARKEGFEITTSVDEGLPATSFDRDAIIQALINLTANAVKYSEDIKRIEVGARYERDSILLWVTDQGTGIGPQELPHLFDKFFRGGEHLTREIGGTGLGLTIVQHIVQVHGGEVSARSTLGAGSTFEILLPIRQTEQMSVKEVR